ncbi:DUF3574 domain-containing protein [bacterium]|jgi:hypothetical protein|nr:DUF3574 domain-containing protein [bacterium]
MITTSIFMGANIPDSGTVSTSMFKSFIENEVANRLDGFTITEGQGYWKGQRERTFILTVIHSYEDVGIKVACEEVAKAYKSQFRQEAVLVASSETVTSFV